MTILKRILNRLQGKHPDDNGYGVIEYEDGTHIVLDEDDAPEITEEQFRNAHFYEHGKLVKKGEGKPPEFGE